METEGKGLKASGTERALQGLSVGLLRNENNENMIGCEKERVKLKQFAS